MPGTRRWWSISSLLLMLGASACTVHCGPPADDGGVMDDSGAQDPGDDDGGAQDAGDDDAGARDAGGGYDAGDQVPVDGGGVCGAAAECQRNFECGSGTVCEIQPGASVGCCQRLVCDDDEHCPGGEVCLVDLGLCVTPPACDPLAADPGCDDGEACVSVNGAPTCVAAALPAGSSCEVVPERLVVASGWEAFASVIARSADGALLPHTEASFTSTVGSFGGQALSATCAGPSACAGTVTADLSGGVTCTGDLLVLPAIAPTEVRFVVFHRETGAALVGAPVAMRIEGEGAPREAVTDEEGVAVFSDVPEAAVLLAASAFPAEQEWITLLEPPGRDLSFPVGARRDSARAAGLKGTLTPTSLLGAGDIVGGLFGLSRTEGALESAAPSPWPVESTVLLQIDGVTGAAGEVVTLPLGSVFTLGTSAVKEELVALGAPGRHLAWGLARRLQLVELSDIITALIEPDDRVASALAASTISASARHALLGPRTLAPITLPEIDGHFDPAEWPLDEVAMSVAAKPSLSFSIDTPTLPCVPGDDTCGEHTDGLTLQLMVSVAGAGVVPLAFAAAADDPDPADGVDQVDGVVDVPSEAPGVVPLRSAPPHSGLEGRPAFVIATSSARDDDGAVYGVAGALSRVTALEASVTLPSFLPFPSGSVSGGTATLTAPAGARLVRLRLDDDSGVWSVWAQGSISEIDLGALRPASVSGRDARATLQAAQLDEGAPEDPFAFGGAHLGQVDEWLSSFSSLSCRAGGSGCVAGP